MPKKQSKYKLVLTTGGIDYKGSGDTFEEAIESLDIESHNIKIKGVMTLSKGKNKVEKLFQPLLLKKLIANKTLRKIWADKFEVLLK